MPQLRLAIYKKLLLHKYTEDRATKETNNIFDITQKRSAWNFCGIDNLSDFSFGDDVFLKDYICPQCEAEIEEDYELEQTSRITEYDEQLVRRLIEKTQFMMINLFSNLNPA